MLLRRFALFLIGFTATSGQILLLREFISTFHGNELVIGVYLSVWLLATAAGSGPMARLFLRRGKTRTGSADSDSFLRFATAQSLSGISLLFAVVGLLALPSPLRPAPGEVAGLTTALASASIFLLPFCLLQGLLFSFGANLLHSESLDDSVSRVYLLESLGAGAGGLLFGLVLVHLLSSFQNIAVLSAVNLFTACFFFSHSDRRRLSQIVYIVAAIVVVICVLDPVTYWAASRRWTGFRVIALRQSHYGNLAVVSLDSQFSTYEDGFLVFTTENVQSAEEAAHIPLLEHPAPTHVLLIGGGVGGVVHEMLKHKTLVRLDYVELDPQLIILSKNVLPRKYVSDLEDPRVRVEYTDGRRFLQRTPERYDVVAMQIPPPYNAQLNRFYTKEFFALVRYHLKPGGVFAFSAPPIAEYVGKELGAFLGSLSKTSESVFASSIIIPASQSFFVCSPDKNPYVVASPESLLSRLSSRNIETFFVRDYFLVSTLSRERLTYVKQRVASSNAGPVNTDLRPTSFYYDMVLWSAEYERSMKGVLEWVFKNRWSAWAITAAAAGTLLAMARWRQRGRLVLSALAVSGFAAIVLELEILLCFQLLYGSLYDRIGVLLSAYMMGLAAGVVVERHGKRSMPSDTATLNRPGTIQIVTAIFALFFLGIVYLAVKTSPNHLVTGASSDGMGIGHESSNAVLGALSPGLVGVLEWFFPIIALVAGALGGALFSSASRAFFACVSLESSGKSAGRDGDGDASHAGIPYAWDLVGSWVGAVLCSVVFFPVVGVATSIAIVMILLVASGLSLVWASS